MTILMLYYHYYNNYNYDCYYYFLQNVFYSLNFPVNTASYRLSQKYFIINNTGNRAKSSQKALLLEQLAKWFAVPLFLTVT